MKKNIVIILLFVVASITAVAQRGEYNSALEVLGGATKFGYSIHGSAVSYFRPKLYFKGTVFYSTEKFYEPLELKHNVYGVDALLGYTLVGGPDSKFNLSIIAGLTTSVEDGNWPNQTTQFNVGKFGGVGGGELEYYFSPRWSAVGHFDYHIVGTNTDTQWGYYRWYGTAGFRYHFKYNVLRSKKCNW